MQIGWKETSTQFCEPMTNYVTINNVSAKECDLIAAALDFYLCNNELSDEVKEYAVGVLSYFDIKAEELAEEDAIEINSLSANDRVTDVEENVIKVDFTNKSV